MADISGIPDPLSNGDAPLVCPRCGKISPAGMRFCGNCGTLLTAENTMVAAARPSEPTTVSPVATENVAVLLPEQAAPIAADPAALSIVAGGTAEETPPIPVVVATSVVPNIAIPDDPLVRERERERRLTLANVQRMRGQTGEAQATLEEAVLFADVEKSHEIAPVYELLGDLYSADGKYDEAKSAYERAFKADNARISAEKKLATTVLRISDAKAMKSLGATMMAGGDVKGMLQSQGTPIKKNAFLALMLSSVIPGLGQFYNGQQRKALIFASVALVSFLLFQVLGNPTELTKEMTTLLTGKKIRGTSEAFSPLPWSLLLLMGGVWLYAMIDAVTVASKGVLPADTPKIDKTGWEV